MGCMEVPDFILLMDDCESEKITDGNCNEVMMSKADEIAKASASKIE